ncbi:MAG: helix-turn-helix transcriptional regulator [Chloroflexota bacterium]
MADKKSFTIRAKIMGVLLRDARLAAGKSLKECGAVLGLTAAAYSAFELGKKSISLPELELVAYYLDTSLNHFWGDATLSEGGERGADMNTGELVYLRQRIIGAQLRQARQAKGMTQKELAAALGASAARIKGFEFGERPVPIPDLEALGDVLGLRIDYFFEKQGPVGEWDATRRAFERFKELPPEVQEFVCNPANESYLRVAMRLADMPSDRLREIAEDILNITF